MRTDFSLAQLADPDTAEAERILRACVHCGFCIATCPTYLLLGDEADSPRGRIHLIKEMLESGQAAAPEATRHIDRCLSCLGCMTTCPSGVHYMHLVDHARRYIEATGGRPWPERALRAMLAAVLPRPPLFRLAILAARIVRPLGGLLPGRLKTLAMSAPDRLPTRLGSDRPGISPATGVRRLRVGLLTGCVQTVLRPRINEATIRLLTRRGAEVVILPEVGCCGALSHHLGQEQAALASVRANVAAWAREIEARGLDAIVINASGCGVMVKDYGFLLRHDPRWAGPAAKVAALARDVCGVVAELGLGSEVGGPNLRLAYHAACSLQHGQKIFDPPEALLRQAGFSVMAIPEGHICCGSAGSYSLLQPDLSIQLRQRKVTAIESLRPAMIATGNIGCLAHIAAGTAVPVLHTVELLDWATGGPQPIEIETQSY